MNAQLDAPPETAVLEIPPETVKLGICNLNFYYGAKQSLFDVSVSFAANAVTALIRVAVSNPGLLSLFGITLPAAAENRSGSGYLFAAG